MPNDAMTVSLHDYLIRLLEDHEKLQDAELAAMDKALVLAREEDKKQFQELNQLRKEVVQDRSQFVYQSVYDAKHEALRTELAIIHKQQEVLDSQIRTWGGVVMFFVVLIQIAFHFWK